MDYCYRKFGHHFAALHTNEERYVDGGVVARDAGLCLTNEERRAILSAALIKRALAPSDIDDILSQNSHNNPSTTEHAVHSNAKNIARTSTHEDDVCCSICLTEFKVSEEVASSTHCTHMFHADCLLEWLAGHDGCPICRENVVTVQEMQSVALELYGEQGVRVMQARSPLRRLHHTGFDVEAQLQVRQIQSRQPSSTSSGAGIPISPVPEGFSA
eukprot:CAMPEP_0196816836 /NCGR_PEP_ID=MMETSP1362-20130617/57243_1 /TAXON_ID=163516 /ORGANISM="Leptocylindrus danicus, Strain CCMP1856" /LENGTH=214 /DNA_ID=CAMNT_0042194305 /DNA_START=69 /DNA_END=716 /DNA_ORIENTATION=-